MQWAGRPFCGSAGGRFYIFFSQARLPARCIVNRPENGRSILHFELTQIDLQWISSQQSMCSRFCTILDTEIVVTLFYKEYLQHSYLFAFSADRFPTVTSIVSAVFRKAGCLLQNCTVNSGNNYYRGKQQRFSAESGREQGGDGGSFLSGQFLSSLSRVSDGGVLVPIVNLIESCNVFNSKKNRFAEDKQRQMTG